MVKTREEILKSKKEYYEKNKIIINQKAKEYNQTEKGKKNQTIYQWKCNGLIAINYELIYDRYYFSSHCEEPKCNKEYTKEYKKCMDHCHLTGLFRNILCNSCNSKRRSKENSSGITNIRKIKNKNSWQYTIQIKGKTHNKCSTDLEWLKNYKKEYENKYLYNI